jgi:hypothetical protein
MERSRKRRRDSGGSRGICCDRALLLRSEVYRRQMGLGEAIDITFDFRSDTPPGKDPDARSPTLRRYHQLLWSKPLPSDAPFELDVATPGVYLHPRSELVHPRY